MSNKPIVIFFKNHQCGPCRAFTPVYEKMSEDKSITDVVRLHIIETGFEVKDEAGEKVRYNYSFSPKWANVVAGKWFPYIIMIPASELPEDVPLTQVYVFGDNNGSPDRTVSRDYETVSAWFKTTAEKCRGHGIQQNQTHQSVPSTQDQSQAVTSITRPSTGFKIRGARK